MAEKVGEIYYEVTLDTSQAIAQQRDLARQLESMPTGLTQAAQAAKTYATATEIAAKANQEAAKAAKEASDAAQQAGAAQQAAATTTKAAAQATQQHEQATKQATKATQDHAKASSNAAMSAGELRQATRQLPMQFTDIFTSLAGGQDPMTVLIQQGGQLKDQFGGIGAAARAMGGYVLGLITPLTAAAAAVAAMTAGFVMGRQEAQNFSSALIMTGQQSGVNADQLSAMAAAMDGMAGVTQAKATEALLTFVNAGVRGSEALASFTAAAIQLEQAGGASVEETAKKFKELEKEPYKAAVKLDEAINFLDQSTKQHIRSLEEQGRLTDAARVAQEAYASAIAGRVPQITENLGFVERAWRAIVSAAKEAGDAILSIGRKSGMNQQLATLKQDLENLNIQAPNAPANSLIGRQKAQLQAQIAAMEQQVKVGADLAAQQAAEAAKKRARDKADADAAKYLTDQQKLQLQLAKELGTLREAGASDAELKAREKAIRDDFAKKQPKGKQPFDSAGNTAILAEKAASDWEKIDIVEAEAVRKNDLHLKKKEISEAEHAKNLELIRAASANKRRELSQGELDDLVRSINEGERIREAEARRAQQRAEKEAQAETEAKKLIAAATEDPVEKIRIEEEAKLAELQSWRDQNLVTLETYERARLAIIAKSAADEKAIQQANNVMSVQLMGKMTGDIFSILEKSGKERTALGKAFFLASKALAVAEIIMNTEVAASKVMQQTGLFGIPMATLVRAQGYASAGMVAGMAVADAVGGRAYGGPVSADSLYRVNEKGAPEMFTASNGSQYMLPTTNGKVTAADKVGGGAPSVNIVVNNTAPGTVASASYDDQSRTVSIAVTEVANQIRTNTGPVWSAMRGATNVQARM